MMFLADSYDGRRFFSYNKISNGISRQHSLEITPAFKKYVRSAIKKLAATNSILRRGNSYRLSALAHTNVDPLTGELKKKKKKRKKKNASKKKKAPKKKAQAPPPTDSSDSPSSHQDE